jgi:hypothetical protein
MLAINTSMIPSEWDPLKWLQYAEATNVMFMDPTNEVLKGPLQGKSAGTYNQLAATGINLEMGNYINQHVQLLSFVKQQLDLISGVNEYRQGDVKGDANVGTSNMGWSASNSMTEKYFSLHNSFKRDCMQRLMEVAKYVWKKNPHKVQAVLDDMGAEVVSYYDEFSESEYDIHIDDGPNTQELMQALNQLAHAGMQTGQIKFRDLIEIYKKDSISGLARYLEEAQDKITQEQQQMQQMQQESQERMAAQAAELKAQELQLEMEKLNREDVNRQLDRENKIQLETIRAMSYAQDQDVNQNAIPDVLEQSKLALEQQKATYQQIQKEKEIRMKDQLEQRKVQVEKDKISLKEKELETKKEIEEMKAETALKIAKENKNKYDKK